MTVNAISLSQFRPAEITSLAKNTFTIVSNVPATETHFHRVNNELGGLVKEVEEKSGRYFGNVLTGPLSDADANRCNLYSSIENYLKGTLHFPDSNLAGNANRLYEIFKKHNVHLTREPYAAKSHYLNGLLADLSKPEAQADLTALNLNRHVDSLREEEEQFENLFLQKVEVLATKDTIDLRTLTDPIRRNLSEIFTMLESFERHLPDIYCTIVEEVNELITEYSSKVKARKTRSSHEDPPVPTAGTTV